MPPAILQLICSLLILNIYLKMNPGYIPMFIMSLIHKFYLQKQFYNLNILSEQLTGAVNG